MSNLQLDTWLSESFTKLTTAVSRDEELHLQIRLAHGAIVEGELVEATPASLTLIRADTGVRAIVPASDVRAIYVHVPNQFRRAIVAVGIIVGATGALVGYSMLPWVDVGQTDFSSALSLIGLLGFIGWGVLRSRTRIRTWLAPWKTLYDSGDA